MPAAQEPPVWLTIAVIWGFCVFFPLFWMLILRLLALFGWDALAAHYRFEGRFPDGVQQYGMTSLSISNTLWLGPNYNNCAVIVLRPEALYVRLWRLFSPWHPPLKIDWQQIERIDTRRLLWASRRVLTLTGTDKKLMLLSRPGTEVERHWRMAVQRRKAL